MKRTFSIFILLLISFVVFGQVEVVKSTEKVNISGKIYYVHKVQPQQTVFSICKTYEIDSEELIAANPAVADGLKAGSLIYIPANEKPLVETQPEDPDDYDDTEINVKTTENVHIVKWYENILILAAKYNVSVDDIVAYNHLSSKILKIGQRILIPQVNAVQTGKYDQEETENTEVTEQIPEENITIDPSNAQAQIKLASAIPHFSEASPLKVTLLLSLNSQSDTPSASYYELYSGALMAIEELKEAGLYLNLKVVDVARNSTLQSFANDISIIGSDIVIGPAEAAKIQSLAPVCKTAKIPFVSLLDTKAEKFVDDNPYFFQMQTRESQRIQNMVNTIAVKPGEEVTLLYDADGGDKAFVDQIKTYLTSSNISFKEVKYNILEGRTIIESLKSRFSKTKENKVIIASETEAFASDAIRNIWLLQLGEYPMTVYCSSKVRNFETIEHESLYDVNTHFSSQFFIDYGSDEIKDFILKYRALFKAEPTSYSFHGYDTFKFFLTAYKDLGREHFMDYIQFYQMNLMQTDIKFEKVSDEGGFINSDTRDVEYLRDYSITVE